MGHFELLRVAAVLGLGLAVLAGCEQKGPMEKAGQKIDKAVGDTSKEMQKAGEDAAKKVRDATK